MLTRLIYASEVAEPLTPDTLQKLIANARRSNERRHITGMLLFDSENFLQVIEGRRSDVSQLFGRIAVDPRHREVELLEVISVEERLFHRWNMGFAAADAVTKPMCLRYSEEPRFAPRKMSARAALALLTGMAGVAA